MKDITREEAERLIDDNLQFSLLDRATVKNVLDVLFSTNPDPVDELAAAVKAWENEVRAWDYQAGDFTTSGDVVEEFAIKGNAMREAFEKRIKELEAQLAIANKEILSWRGKDIKEKYEVLKDPEGRPIEDAIDEAEYRMGER